MKCHALVGCGDLIMNCNLNGVSPEICQYSAKITSRKQLPICLDQRTWKLSIYHENVFEIAVGSFSLSLDGEVIGSNHTEKNRSERRKLGWNSAYPVFGGSGEMSVNNRYHVTQERGHSPAALKLEIDLLLKLSG
jgi:hypothetical protein